MQNDVLNVVTIFDKDSLFPKKKRGNFFIRIKMVISLGKSVKVKTKKRDKNI